MRIMTWYVNDALSLKRQNMLDGYKSLKLGIETSKIIIIICRVVARVCSTWSAQ